MTAQILIEVEVWEHYPGVDYPPEPFGFYRYLANAPPKVGDVIMLKWLDGTDAYERKIIRIDDHAIHVKPVDS